MRLRYSLPAIIFVIAMLWMGAQYLHTYFANLAPTSITIAEYVRTKPKARWLEFSDGSFSLLEAMPFERDGTIRGLYIPIHSTSDSDTAKVHVVLSTKKGYLLSIYKQIADAKTEEAEDKVVEANRGKVFHGRPVRGLIRKGLDLLEREKDRKKERSELQALDTSLAADFIIIEGEDEPSLFLGLFITAIPVLFIALNRKGILAWVRGERHAPEKGSAAEARGPRG